MSLDWVELTDHAAARWKQRSSSSRKIGPVVAWQEAVELDEPHGFEADEVRYHEESETLLVQRNRCLVTVVDAEPCEPTARAAIERLEATA